MMKDLPVFLKILFYFTKGVSEPMQVRSLHATNAIKRLEKKSKNEA